MILPQAHVSPTSESVPDASSQGQQNRKKVADSEPIFNLGLVPQEAALLLLEYRTLMADQFPFVVVLPDATSESLRKERPVLWGAIMTAASYHNPVRQEALGWKMMEEFSTRLLIKAEKSLDLLQGLLIHLSW